MGDFHHVSRLRIHGKADVACHLLAEIHHRLSLRCGEYTLCGHILFLPGLFALLRNQILRSLFQAYDGQRLLRHKCGVTGFSVIDLAEPDPALLCRPALIRRNDLFRSVLTGQNQLRNQPGGHMRSYSLSFLIHPTGHGASIPALSHNHFQPVVLFQQIRHIIALILLPFFIGSPAGGEHIFSHPLSVQAGFINAHGGDEKLCLRHAFFPCKLLHKYRTHISHFLCRRDPFRTPLHDSTTFLPSPAAFKY